MNANINVVGARARAGTETLVVNSAGAALQRRAPLTMAQTVALKWIERYAPAHVALHAPGSAMRL